MLSAETPATLKGEALWGAKSIAAFIATPVDKVPVLRQAGAPIAKIGGQLFALRSELFEWLQQQATQDRP